MARRKGKPSRGRRRPAKRAPRGFLGRWAIRLGAIGALAAIAWVASLEIEIREFLRTRSTDLVRIYSAPFELAPGVNLKGARVEARLGRLGYREVGGRPEEPGQFRTGRESWLVHLRGFSDPLGRTDPVLVRLDVSPWTTIRSVVDEGGRRGLERALLEPETIGSFGGSALEERSPVVLANLPEHVPRALLAAEDVRFFYHPGIDPIGLVRAAFVNLRERGVRQGGSTVSQQLAKNLFLSHERSWMRKASEAVLAVLLEIHLDKDEILELYMNSVYFGRVGSLALYGITPASRGLFGKEAAELDPAEAATLAGLIRAPNHYSPIRHPERARVRRDQVLETMREQGWIDAATADAARGDAVKTVKGRFGPVEAPFFVDEVLRRLRKLGYSPARVRGLSVYTALDPELQRVAEDALARELERLEAAYPRLRRPEKPIEGAVALLEAETGFVRGLVGGRDFGRSQFNRATRSRRQPGSAFKPFVYLAAFDHPDAGITPVTPLSDEPLELRVGRDLWKPTNYDERFLGEVSVRRALEGSRNVPTVRLALRTGIGRVADLGRRLGLGDLEPVPSIALGAEEVSLVDLVGAYTVFPNQGEVVRPALFRGVVANDGTVLYRDEVRRVRVATAPASFVTSTLLEGVIHRGTGARVRQLGLDVPAAGKTGTTNDARDGWFVGYTPILVTGVWVGFDDGTPVGLTGASSALPVWVEIMKAAKGFSVPPSFEPPDGVVFRDVNPETGLLPSFACPDSRLEAFVIGTEPTETCRGFFGARSAEPIRGSDGERPVSGRARQDPDWKGLSDWVKGLLGPGR